MKKTNNNSPTYILHDLLPISNLIICIVPPKKKLKMKRPEQGLLPLPSLRFPEVTPPKVQSISLKPRRRRRSAEANNLQAAGHRKATHPKTFLWDVMMMVSKPTNLLRPPEKSVMNGGREPGCFQVQDSIGGHLKNTQMTGWEVFPTFFQ